MTDRRVITVLTTLFFCAFALPAALSVLSITIIPDIRGISTTLGVRAALAVLLAVLGISGIPADRTSMGWRRPGIGDALPALGLTAATLGLGLLFPAKAVPLPSAGGAVFALSAVLVIVSAIAEELFFRSWLLRSLPVMGFSTGGAVFLSTVLFAFIHAGGGWSSVLFAGIAGLLYAMVFLRRGNLWIILAAHVLHNTLAFALHSAA